MPIYDFLCEKCKHTWEKQLIMADREKPTTEPCPQCGERDTVHQYLPHAAAIGDPVRLGIKKPSGLFRELQSKIAQNHPKHEMNVR